MRQSRRIIQTAVMALAVALLASCGNSDSIGSQSGNTQAHNVSPGNVLPPPNPPAGDATYRALGGEGAASGGQALAGGSETANRVLKPMENYLLQRKYPNTLVLRGSLQSNQAALTFDDGPDARFTPQVLDVLKKHGVKATFFLMGSRVDGHPEVTRRIHHEGHVIGNHTYWHPKLYQESIGRLRWEVSQTDASIRKITGYSPKLFRAPYGGLNDETVKELQSQNFSVIGWSVDSLDWTQANAETVRKNVLSNMHPGAIILMHSGGHWTQDLSGMVEALDKLIPELKQEGIQFVTIPQLFNIPDKK